MFVRLCRTINNHKKIIFGNILHRNVSNMKSAKNNVLLREPRQGPPLWLWVVMIIGLLGVAAGIVLTQSGGKPGAASGPPQLTIDQEVINLGDVPLGQAVTATFTITNTGGEMLRFTKAPWIEVMDGC